MKELTKPIAKIGIALIAFAMFIIAMSMCSCSVTSDLTINDRMDYKVMFTTEDYILVLNHADSTEIMSINNKDKLMLVAGSYILLDEQFRYTPSSNVTNLKFYAKIKY